MEKVFDILFWVVFALGFLLAAGVIGFRLWEDWTEQRRTAPWRNPEVFRRRLQGLAEASRRGAAKHG